MLQYSTFRIWHHWTVLTWLQAVLGGTGAVISALIAGSFAVRNAKRAPHDNLKSLIDIGSVDSGLLSDEDVSVLREAVHQEVVRIGRLSDARTQGFWAYQRERLEILFRIEGNPIIRSSMIEWFIVLYASAVFVLPLLRKIIIAEHGDFNHISTLEWTLGALASPLFTWAAIRLIILLLASILRNPRVFWINFFPMILWGFVFGGDLVSGVPSRWFSGITRIFVLSLLSIGIIWMFIWIGRQRRKLETALYWRYRDNGWVRIFLRYRSLRANRARLIKRFPSEPNFWSGIS